MLHVKLWKPAVSVPVTVLLCVSVSVGLQLCCSSVTAAAFLACFGYEAAGSSWKLDLYKPLLALFLVFTRRIIAVAHRPSAAVSLPVHERQRYNAVMRHTCKPVILSKALKCGYIGPSRRFGESQADHELGGRTRRSCEKSLSDAFNQRKRSCGT
jgi:hypothetical protein